MTVDYKAILVATLTAIVVFGILSNITSLVSDIPSEEKCQRIIGYANEQKEYAERYFCEYNETGWHLNKTKFSEALRSVT